MIVVAVIGLLAAIAVPNFVRARENAQNGRYLSDLRVATGAFQEYAIEYGSYPNDKLPGQIPDGMQDYLARMKWTQRNSLGGQWDWDFQQFGATAGVSVYQPKASNEQLIRLDGIIDDGNLAVGNFRQRSSGYIYIIE
jgi:type II secretory pathway pseudopilin PulG